MRWLAQWVGLVVLVFAGLEPCWGAGLGGSVVLPDGSAAKGADVYLFAGEEDSSKSSEMQAIKTDEGGNFNFENVAAGLKYRNVVAVAKGWGMVGRRFGGDQPVRLQLRPAVDVTVQLVDAQNKPVADVAVSLRILIFRNGIGFDDISAVVLPETVLPAFSGKTDAGGAITFAGLSQSSQVGLGVNDDRYAELTYAEYIQLPAKSSFTAEAMQVHSAGNISGNVTFGETDKPVAGIGVAAQSQNGWGEAITADDGSYHLGRLCAGKYNVALNLNNGLEEKWTAVAVEGVVVGEGEKKADVNLKVISGATIVGKVLAKEDGTPIPNIYIGVYGPAHPRSGGQVQMAISGADGSFGLRVPPGEQYLYVARASQNAEAQPNQTITVADGKTATVEFRIPNPAVVRVAGKVVGPDGAPVADALITATTKSLNGPPSRPWTIKSNADGSFQLHDNVEPAEIQLRARSGELATPVAVDIPSDSKDFVIHLEKNALASIAGRVIDGDGKPLSGAKIMLIVMNGRYGSGESAGETDDKGTYKIDNLYADTKCSVQAQRQGYGHGGVHKIALKSGATFAAQDMMLKKLDSSIAGMILDDDGNPVAGQQVYVLGDATGSENALTDKGGKFRLAVVTGDNRLEIMVKLPGRPFIRKTVKAGDQGIVIDEMLEKGN